MDKILEAPIHIIVTARGKDEYVLEEKNGRQQPKKIGMGAQQEKDIEYNYTVTFNLAQDTNIAECQKDNTHLFEGRYDKLTEADGIALYKWANKGKEAVPKPKPKAETPATNEITDEIAAAITSLINSGVPKANITETIKGICGIGNYTKVTEEDKLKAVLETLKNYNDGGIN